MKRSSIVVIKGEKYADMYQMQKYARAAQLTLFVTPTVLYTRSRA
jgi:putative cell wall-binding protein